MQSHTNNSKLLLTIQSASSVIEITCFAHVRPKQIVPLWLMILTPVLVKRWFESSDVDCLFEP